MVEQRHTLRECWEDILNDLPEGTAEHVKLSLEAMFYTGVWSYESLLKNTSRTMEPEQFLAGLRTLQEELREAFRDLDGRKQRWTKDHLRNRKGKAKH